MRYKTQAIVALLLLWVCTCAFGQDMSMFKEFRTLTPVPSWDGRSDKNMLLVYKTRGVMFVVNNTGFREVEAAVFAPASTRPVGSFSHGTDDVVPGVGARGVMLGASRDQVRQSPFAAVAKLEAEDARFATYRADVTRFLIIQFAGEAVLQLHVMGDFRTPEGVTHKSRIPDIERIYGRADEYYQVVTERDSVWLILVFPMMLVFGLLTGLSMRGRMQDGSRESLIRAAVFGAVTLAVFEVSSGFIATSFITEVSFDWKGQPLLMAAAGLTGAICMPMMKVLGNRMVGCMGALVTLFLMVLVSQVIGVLATVAGAMTFSIWLVMLPGTGTLFVIGMFLAGRTTTGG